MFYKTFVFLIFVKVIHPKVHLLDFGSIYLPTLVHVCHEERLLIYMWRMFKIVDLCKVFDIWSHNKR
jgi:hypothetical protein